MRMGFELAGGGPTTETYLESGAVPMGSLLPAVYQEYDENALRFTAALDAVVAPVWLAIDCFDAYLSPLAAPEDVAAWLATWVGIAVDDNWHPDQLRRLVMRSFELYRWRGTARGVADLVEAYTGLRPEVEDTGGVTASATVGGAGLRPDEASVVVRVRGVSLDADSLERLTALVRSSIPAHVTARVEVA